MKSRINSGRNS